MGFLSNIGSKLASGTIGSLLESTGEFAKDVRQALTGELSQEQQTNLLERADQIEQQQIKAQSELNQVQGEIIKAEASGESYLQRNWRPIVMLVFAGLVVAHWLGYTAENLSEGSISMLLGIVKIGIGGYVIGRSGEKIAPQVIKAIKGKD
jgi:hypothetical protein